MLTDFHWIAALRDLPALRVIDQVLGPTHLELPRERRATSIVCPRCQTSCARVRERRPRSLRDWPILERPVVLVWPMRRLACRGCPSRPWETRATFGRRTKWTDRLSHRVREAGLRGGPGQALARRSGLAERRVLRWTFARRRGGRPRTRGHAIGLEDDARRQGHHDNPVIVDVDTGKPMVPFPGRRADEVVAWWRGRPPEEWARVAGVVAEMAKPYAAAITEVCGDQGQVIDRFHGVPQAVEALDAVWRAVKTPLDQDEAKALQQLRKRWLQSSDQRHVDASIAREDWCRRFPE